MYVIKRDGRRELVMFDKITARVKKLSWGLSDAIDPTLVAQKVCSGVYTGVQTTELDELAAQTAAHMVTDHPDYGLLASRITVSNLHKATRKSFSGTMRRLFEYVNPETGQPSPLIAANTMKIISDHARDLNSAIIYDRDFGYDYFGIKTLERSYLLKINGKIAERPQHMLMRVAVGIHGNDIDAAITSYNYMSERWFTHASPTLFNAGTPRPQLSSCFLLQMKADSIEGIYDTLKQCALISKNAGGVGLAIHKIRAKGSYISGTNGASNGLVPMIRVFNNTARYVDQGGGKRKGAFALYIEPWHADVFDFLELRKNHGKEEERARDLFYALWIPDLFMERVEQNGDWTLMCPNTCSGLAEAWGDAFKELYTRYEQEGRGLKTIRARELWNAIVTSQIETGTPFMLYKDAANRKSNQKNIGTIQCSNLCTEIMEYTSPDEVAVCNLASLGLPRFVNPETREFDFETLHKVTYHVTGNLNKVIDVNFYPVPEARSSNMKHRPIGIGVQGLADVFMLMRMPFDSAEARELNVQIFETIYHAALTASNDLAIRDGPYESFDGSPASEGVLQFDMWDICPESKRYDWDDLKQKIKEHGLRNSLLVTMMPTASTSQILGNNESIEPYTSNVYVRRVLAGEFVCVNTHLLRDLISRGVWSDSLKNKLLAANGSVQKLAQVPDDLKRLYRTVWEIPQKALIEMAADRGAFIDQSQSFNVHMKQPNFAKMSSMHFFAWKAGLKTGQYYLRSQASADAIKFTVDQHALDEDDKKSAVCNEDTCTSCGA